MECGNAIGPQVHAGPAVRVHGLQRDDVGHGLNEFNASTSALRSSGVSSQDSTRKAPASRPAIISGDSTAISSCSAGSIVTPSPIASGALVMLVMTNMAEV